MKQVDASNRTAASSEAEPVDASSLAGQTTTVSTEYADIVPMGGVAPRTSSKRKLPKKKWSKFVVSRPAVSTMTSSSVDPDNAENG